MKKLKFTYQECISFVDSMKTEIKNHNTPLPTKIVIIKDIYDSMTKSERKFFYKHTTKNNIIGLILFMDKGNQYKMDKEGNIHLISEGI